MYIKSENKIINNVNAKGFEELTRKILRHTCGREILKDTITMISIVWNIILMCVESIIILVKYIPYMKEMFCFINMKHNPACLQVDA